MFLAGRRRLPGLREGARCRANRPGPHKAHFANFVECVKTRKTPNADIAVGHKSTLLAHMGNISYRLGGRKICSDPTTETCDVPEANAVIKRTYRKPWVVPDEV